jgi:glutamate synthase (NADPH/NADH) small chain
MGKVTGFLEFNREPPERRPLHERIKDFQELYGDWPEVAAREQGARCMNCALPFCEQGCPLGNLIPNWNDLVYKGRWKEALTALHATNNFPEFTGRICPAPCEASCVLAINDEAVTIEYIEKAIVDRGFEEGWITPEPPQTRTGKKVAIVGSGPAGLATAQQLNRAGHLVTVFERSEVIGGLLTIGIPDFKLEAAVVERRVKLMADEGIEFRTGCEIGGNLPVSDLQRDFDAICLAGGSTIARRLNTPGEDLEGVHLAMDYLAQQNRINQGQSVPDDQRISAEGKQVIILGGGDTGADCLGTAHRQGAASVLQWEILPEPPGQRSEVNPWPQWPLVLRTSAAHEEGGIRDYNILTTHLSGSNGQVQKIHGVRIEWGTPDETGRPVMTRVPGSEFEVEAQMVLLALGFLHPQREGLLEQLGVALDVRGNVKTGIDKQTSVPGVFAAGDMARGQSLVVWAIAEGRQAAHSMDGFLSGKTSLPSVDLRSWT